MPMKSSKWSIVAAIALLALSAALFVFAVPAIFGHKAGDMDFIAYWVAGHQLVHGANPYDVAATFRLEREAGLTDNFPDMLLNMPNALFLFLPLGLVSAKTGMGIWLLTSVLCLVGSIWMLWILFGQADNALHLSGFAFAPVIACMFAGQVSIFVLFGIVLFLYFHRSRPFWAGAALLLCSLKPHLLLPFAIALLAWTLTRRAYSILLGAVTSCIASVALGYLTDAHAWSQYVQLMKDSKFQQAIVPTLSTLLRILLDRDSVWLQYAPAAAASGWALWYFWSRRDAWSWMHHGLVVLLVSVLCAPHAYLYDEAVVLPVIFAAMYRPGNTRRVLLAFCVLNGIILIGIGNHLKLSSFSYIWTAPAWAGLYAYAYRRRRTSNDELALLRTNKISTIDCPDGDLVSFGPAQIPDRSTIRLGIVCPMANEGNDAVKFCNDVLRRCVGLGGVTFFAVFDQKTTDSSLDQMRELERVEPRLKVVWAPDNRGAVDAYVRGYREAISAGCDWILEIDAGYSHLPSEIPQFLDAMDCDKDCVFGSRVLGTFGNSPSKRRLVSKGGTLLSNLLLGTKQTDMTSGFQMFKRETLQMILDRGIRSKAHFFQTEMKTYCRKLDLLELPITYSNPSPRLKSSAIEDSLMQLLQLFRLRLQGRL
jgi:dolichol-phosphate mannosyltransferase